ncbi:MAG: four helix bundle protein [Candidatus Marinimicrobia bacterium]|nr:four helix bundle protein [Candidatus Neomarinimicrobiota bacterium]
MDHHNSYFTDQHHSERKVSNNINEPPLNYDSKRDFTSLEAWKKARAVKLFFYERILPKLPVEERYNLGSQIRDSGVSATANIASPV